MPAKRIERITQANEALLSFLDLWDSYRHQPNIADFAFGNPQEMVIDGFPAALASATVPRDKDHYAYKFSEDESRRSVAKHLTEWRGQPFETCRHRHDIRSVRRHRGSASRAPGPGR